MKWICYPPAFQKGNILNVFLCTCVHVCYFRNRNMQSVFRYQTDFANPTLFNNSRCYRVWKKTCCFLFLCYQLRLLPPFTETTVVFTCLGAYRVFLFNLVVLIKNKNILFSCSFAYNVFNNYRCLKEKPAVLVFLFADRVFFVYLAVTHWLKTNTCLLPCFLFAHRLFPELRLLPCKKHDCFVVFCIPCFSKFWQCLLLFVRSGHRVKQNKK